MSPGPDWRRLGGLPGDRALLYVCSVSEAEDPREELMRLTSALRAHLEWSQSTGAIGLPAASAELRASRPPAEAEAAPEPTQAPSQTDPVNSDSKRWDRDKGTAHAPPPRKPAPMAEPRESELATVSGPEMRAPELQSRSAEPGAGGVTPAPAVPAVIAASPKSPKPQQTERASPTERGAQLQLLEQEVAGCTRCRLHETRTHTVFARGTGSSGLCFIGEGPGADEDEQGSPFVGKAGQLLDKMIAAMGLERDAVYVCNIVKCRPPGNRKPQPDEMGACRAYLAAQLELIEPQIVVALGATAVEGLLGTSGGITRIRGRWRLYQGQIPVMPTFHPAYLLRNPRAKRDVWGDLQQVQKQLELNSGERD